MAHPRRKRRTQKFASQHNARAQGINKPNLASRIPKSMVIRMGANEGSSFTQLVRDMRQVMEPHTASRLQERKSNRLRDYVTMAGPLGVSHLLLFYRARETGNINLKIAVTPRGPTLTFRIENWVLAKDVAKRQRRPKTGNAGLDRLTPPLLVLNNFNAPHRPPPAPDSVFDLKAQHSNPIPRHLETLTTSVFQSLFPPVSPQQTPLTSIRRVMLVDRTISSHTKHEPYVIQLRHYAITSRPILSPLLSRGLKRLNQAKSHAQHRPYSRGRLESESTTGNAVHVPRKISRGALPDLGNLDDVADYLLDSSANAGYASASESEAEGTEAEVDVIKEPMAKRAWTPKEREGFHRRQEDLLQSQQEQVPNKGNKINGGKFGETLPLSQRTQKQAVKLTELGPRMRLRLYKVEEGLCSGKVMWHELVTKSKDENKATEEKWRMREQEKKMRQREQQENVEKKKRAKSMIQNKNGQGANGITEDGDVNDEIMERINYDAEWSDADDDMQIGDEDLG